MPLIETALRTYTQLFPVNFGKHRMIHTLRRFIHSTQTVTLPFGPRITLDTREHLQRDIFFFGQYEPEETAFLSDILKPGMTFIDCGANCGYFTLLGASKVGPYGKVIAVEPDPSNLAQLRHNIELNGLKNVEVLECVVSDTEKPLSFFVNVRQFPNRNNGLNSLRHRDPTWPSKEITVRSILLDSLSLSRCDVIKMDIQGAELLALRGAKALLKKFRPTLVLEAFEFCTQHFDYSVSDLKRFLIECGYTLRDLDEVTIIAQ